MLQADLIHVGARYSPCMRNDRNIAKLLQQDRAAENETGCCVYNDGSGCVQTSSGKCPVSHCTVWMKSIKNYM